MLPWVKAESLLAMKLTDSPGDGTRHLTCARRVFHPGTAPTALAVRLKPLTELVRNQDKKEDEMGQHEQIQLNCVPQTDRLQP